jgi:hypothetical protein
MVLYRATKSEIRRLDANCANGREFLNAESTFERPFVKTPRYRESASGCLFPNHVLDFLNLLFGSFVCRIHLGNLLENVAGFGHVSIQGCDNGDVYAQTDVITKLPITTDPDTVARAFHERHVLMLELLHILATLFLNRIPIQPDIAPLNTRERILSYLSAPTSPSSSSALDLENPVGPQLVLPQHGFQGIFP